MATANRNGHAGETATDVVRHIERLPQPEQRKLVEWVMMSWAEEATGEELREVFDFASVAAQNGFLKSVAERFLALAVVGWRNLGKLTEANAPEFSRLVAILKKTVRSHENRKRKSDPKLVNEVYALKARGLTDQKIADKLFITLGAVRKRRKTARRKKLGG